MSKQYIYKVLFFSMDPEEIIEPSIIISKNVSEKDLKDSAKLQERIKSEGLQIKRINNDHFFEKNDTIITLLSFIKLEYEYTKNKNKILPNNNTLNNIRKKKINYKVEYPYLEYSDKVKNYFKNISKIKENKELEGIYNDFFQETDKIKNNKSIIENIVNKYVQEKFKTNKTDIKNILTELSKSTNGFINYCVIIDKEKAIFASSGSIIRRRSIKVNHQEGGDFGVTFMIICIVLFICFCIRRNRKIGKP